MKPAVVPPGPGFKETLPTLIRWAADTHKDKEFLVLGDQRLSFIDAERQSRELAKGLLALGTGKATRVGLLMPNNPDWTVCWFASARAGALTVAMSTFFQAPEIAYALRHTDIDTLLISARYLNADYLERLERALPGLADHKSPELYLPEFPFLRRIVVWGECDRPWALAGPKAILTAADQKPQIDDHYLEQVEKNIAPADDLLLINTSGSTAEPKAVVHTHGVTIRSTFEFLEFGDTRPDDRSYPGMPFFWIGGINVNTMPAIYRGATMFFSPTPKPSDIVDLIERERLTRVSLWPTQVDGILEAAKGRDISSIERGLPPARDPWGDLIPSDRSSTGFGMTESFGMHSLDYVWLPAPVGKGGNFGRCVRGMERMVIDPNTLKELPPGEEGELYIRGSNLMRGYYKKEREEFLTRDGWFATGDLAYIDEEGFLFFKGRRNEMIKTSGANVSPREVELALMQYPEISEPIVFGIPDPIKGEAVIAVLIPQAGKTLDTDEILERLKADISPYKVPTQAFVMDFEEIPRTAAQKPKKPALKEIILQRLGKN